MKFSIKDFFSKPQETADLVIFTEEIFNGKLHFLCSEEPTVKPFEFVSRIAVNECLKNSVQNCFIFALISNYW